LLVLFRLLLIALALIEDDKFISVLSLWLHNMEIKLLSYDLSLRACFAVVLQL